MICDHAPARATIAAFRAATDRFTYYLDDNDEGGTALFGNCTRCHSTIGIPITEVRASVVASGEIVGPAGKVARYLEDLPETMDEHARRVIK